MSFHSQFCRQNRWRIISLLSVLILPWLNFTGRSLFLSACGSNSKCFQLSHCCWTTKPELLPLSGWLLGSAGNQGCWMRSWVWSWMPSWLPLWFPPSIAATPIAWVRLWEAAREGRRRFLSDWQGYRGMIYLTRGWTAGNGDGTGISIYFPGGSGVPERAADGAAPLIPATATAGTCPALFPQELH